MNKLEIRPSEIRKYLRCRRAWWLKFRAGEHGLGYNLPRVGPDSSGAARGTAVHAAILAHYRGEDPFAAIAEHTTPPEGCEIDDAAEWMKVRELATLMVEGFLEWKDDEGLDVGVEFLRMEEPVRFPLDVPGYDGEVWIVGTPDAVVYDPSFSGVVVRDYKTVQTLTQRPEQVDTQLLTYALAWAWETGDVPRAGEHIQLRSVKRTARATPPFYGRAPIVLTRTQVVRHLEHLRSVVGEMVALINSAGGDGPQVTHSGLIPNPTKDCSWDCEFRIPCATIDDGSDYQAILDLTYARNEAPDPDPDQETDQ